MGTKLPLAIKGFTYFKLKNMRSSEIRMHNSHRNTNIVIHISKKLADDVDARIKTNEFIVVANDLELPLKLILKIYEVTRDAT